MVERLEGIERAKGWLDAFRPLPGAVTEELRHRYEVRLTYHSTAIEGNTLTQSETQIVIEKGVTIGGKSVLEHLEVIGHEQALDFVRLLADAQGPIGEGGPPARHARPGRRRSRRVPHARCDGGGN